MFSSGIFDAWNLGTHVPAWNLFVLRALNFAVYFIAGLKKLASEDWTEGHSMTQVTEYPFFRDLVRPLVEPTLVILNAVSGSKVTFDNDFRKFLVNTCGMVFDLFVGWLLLVPSTRSLACIFCLFFHFMTRAHGRMD